MELRVTRLTIDNFKGTKHADISFGPVTNIFARNGAGKSTIVDAFYWVLFNKDSAGNAPGSDKFREKPLDSNGEEIHNLDTVVAIYGLLDGKEFDLKRVQRENWVKKRGASDAVYNGNVSTYYINEIETKVSEFRDRVFAICDENVFPLIATMSAFNKNLDWKKRREILVGASGVDVDSVLVTNPAYKDLVSECETRNINVDELKKVLQDTLRRMNKDLEMIPIRIDEAMKQIPAVNEKDVDVAKSEIEDLESKIDQMKKKLLMLKNGEETEDEVRLRDIDAKMADLLVKLTRDRDAERARLCAQKVDNEKKHDVLTVKIAGAAAKLESSKQRAELMKTKVEEQRGRYKEVFSRKYVSKVDSVCPACGQPLPAEKVEEANKAAKEAFENDKKMELERIRENGVSTKQALDELDASIKETETIIVEYEGQSDECSKELLSINSELMGLSARYDANGNEEYVALQNEAMEIRMRIAGKPSDDRISALEGEIEDLNARINKAKEVLVLSGISEQLKVRVKDLEENQKRLGVEIAKTERMIMLSEKYVQDRCGKLEESINALFPSIRWKLFNTQINGGIADTCVCMIPCDGAMVAYDSANTASQLHADIEIINVLSRLYGTKLPVFFDNRERVNDVPATEGQLITLSVSDDADMRIEF